MRGVRKNRYREATRTLQSGVPDNLRGCWSGLYPYASRSKYQKEANSTSRRRLRELALGRVGRTRRSGSRNTRRRALRGPDQTPRHRPSRALNVARILNTAE